MIDDLINLQFLDALQRYAATGKQVGVLAAPVVLARQSKGDREFLENQYASALGRLLKRKLVSIVKTPTGGSYIKSERKLTSVPPRRA